MIITETERLLISKFSLDDAPFFMELVNSPHWIKYIGERHIKTIAEAKEAIKNAGISDINTYKTGLISATSVGGMDMTEKYYYDYLTDTSTQKYIAGHNAGDSTQKIAEQLGIHSSLVTTISTACSSAANAIMFGDANDDNSEVTKWRSDDKNYYLLEELGVKATVSYLLKVRNVEERVTYYAEEEHKGGHEGHGEKHEEHKEENQTEEGRHVRQEAAGGDADGRT